MTYQEFKDTVCGFVRLSLEEKNAVVSVQTILKNNDTPFDGLTITEDGINISPTIYLNYFYKKYLNGTDIQKIVEEIVTTYQDNRPADNIDTAFFTDFDRVKDRIVFKLINYEKNQKLLSDVPFLQYLDLAIVFYCLISTDSSGSATILIHNHHLSYWNTDINALYNRAKINTPILLGSKVQNMSSVLEEVLAEDSSLNVAEEDLEFPMYVLSNRLKLNGASCILYSNILEEFSNRVNSDFYVLPSSVHEVILVPSQSPDSYEELSAMVREVNESQVAFDEILSDHVYYYSRQKKQLCM